MPKVPEFWPPTWLTADVEFLLRAAIDGRLHTRTTSMTIEGWFHDRPEPAIPASDDQSETIGILEQHGCLVVGSRARLTDADSGEEFVAERVEITPSGRYLFDRLCSHHRDET